MCISVQALLACSLAVHAATPPHTGVAAGVGWHFIFHEPPPASPGFVAGVAGLTKPLPVTLRVCEPVALFRLSACVTNPGKKGPHHACCNDPVRTDGRDVTE